jgi:hypothetical protein
MVGKSLRGFQTHYIKTASFLVIKAGNRKKTAGRDCRLTERFG